MSDKSAIEWTDATWNPVSGCSKVSPGCAHCYAETFAQRGLGGFAGGRPFEDVRCHEDRLSIPTRWRRPRRVFVNSMSDLFHEAVPDSFIDHVFAVVALAPQHTFQVLTKRAERMRAYFGFHEDEPLDLRDRIDDAAGHFGACHANLDDRWPLPNVRVGVSIENQHFGCVRFPVVTDLGAAGWNTMVSLEPLLERVVIPETYLMLGHLAWCIVGGESGPKARPMDLGWARAIVAQCKVAGVACFVKQIGARPWWDGIGPAPMARHLYHEQATLCGRVGWRLDCLRDKKGGDPSEWPEDLRVRQYPVERSA